MTKSSSLPENPTPGLSRDVSDWLIREGRLLEDEAAIVEGYATRLVSAGVPLARANITHQFANPLMVAWGVIWTPEETTPHTVLHTTLDTAAFKGSSFEYVRDTGMSLRKRLVGLDVTREHASYVEFAADGGTDFFAMPMEYSEGSVSGCTFLTRAPYGFSDEHIGIIEDSRHALACATEPLALRKSLTSLLQTYLGDGPARSVSDGTTQRGAHSQLEAVVMFTDLRDFTRRSEQWPEEKLFSALDSYFESVVDAVRSNGGDVLKFMGDGILSIFPIGDEASRATQSARAVSAARGALASLNAVNLEQGRSEEDCLRIGIGINIGTVTYGNIGSPDRLDFTVLGSAVNVASRVQDLCKVLGHSVLATSSVAACVPDTLTSWGQHEIRGVAEPVEVFRLVS